MKAKKSNYQYEKIEQKWQKKWLDEKVYSPNLQTAKNPYYSLMMFPYPSGEGLHVGNAYAFTGSDIWGRYQRMLEKDVFEPIGLDGFGIHSENYAIKLGTHPLDQSKKTEPRFYNQLQSMGLGIDWDKRLETYKPDYYRWTQWLFIQMFKNGLAYRQKAAVNWCPSCKTVLADEQVIAEKCERCSSVVEKRNLEQWFFRITAYADRLLENLDKINWVDTIKTIQRQWIGKSEGAEIEFKLDRIDAQSDKTQSVSIFTTRPDTLYGATFLVISPELADSWLNTGWEPEENVKKYIKLALDRRKSANPSTEKTGVFTGVYAINPINDKKIPLWVSDYVLAGYGTGAIMAVPAHDDRDLEFATKFNLEIIPVIEPLKANNNIEDKVEQKAYTGTGTLINSDDWNGFVVPSELSKVLDSLEEKGKGKRKTNYHLRDWLISRQRYWGPPIPMIYCQSCASADKGERKEMPGWYTVPENGLPVELPYVENFKPTGTGESPLGQDKEWAKTPCPGCGQEAKRETEVSDTFLDSAWYFLRYPSVGIDDKPFDLELTKKWLPVNMYIGGAEHAVLHLMYSRFVSMALKDWGITDFEEPFTRFYAHGLLIKDGAKMSKSKGNVVVPDVYIQKYGADTLRMYLMFLGPYEAGGDFRDSGIEGMNRFIKRVHTLITDHFSADFKPETAKVMSSLTHKTINRVTTDLENLRYNRAIAGIMEYVNGLNKMVGEWSEEKANEFGKINEWEEAIKTLLLLLAPFAPHMTEELWQNYFVGEKYLSIHKQNWPKYDSSKTIESSVNIQVQVNGKLRGTIFMDTSVIETQELVETEAKKLLSVLRQLEGKSIQKVIYIKGKLVNFVVS